MVGSRVTNDERCGGNYPLVGIAGGPANALLRLHTCHQRVLFMPGTKVGTISVAVVEPRGITRRGLVVTLSEFGYTVALSVATVPELMAAFAQHPDIAVVIVELEMPKPDGFVLRPWLKERWPKVGLIGFGTHPPGATTQRAMRLGMGSVFDDHDSDAELCATVKGVAAEGRYLSALLHRMSMDPAPPPIRPGKAVDLSVLAPKEMEYLRYHCAKDDPSLDTIAKRMGVEKSTARTWRQRIYKKLGVHCPQALLRLAVQAGVVRM